VTEEPTKPRHGVDATGSPGSRPDAAGAETNNDESFSLRTRPYWSIAFLIFVGIYSFLRYPHSGLPGFYSTAASVIATLYVAVALSVFASKDSPGNEMTFEHWLFMVASTAGLLASLRALSIGRVQESWQTGLLTGLTVIGLTATVSLVAERLVAWRIARTKAAFWWPALFLGVAVTLVIFP
jgi:hypothetical protein